MSRATLAKLAISTALFLVLQECALRIVFPLPEVQSFNRALYMHVPTAGSGDTPVRSVDVRWDSAPDGASFVHRLNRYGFRDREWTRAKPEGVHRVVFIGDSFMEGAMAPKDQTIPAGFAAAAAEEGGPELEVMNLGIIGLALPEYHRLVHDALTLFEPDTVILGLFSNDFTFVPPPYEGTAFEPWPGWKPRAVELIGMVARRETLPMRWNLVSQGYHAVSPSPNNPWSGRDAELLRFCEHGMAQDILEGRFNPYRPDFAEFLLLKCQDPVDLLGTLTDLKEATGRHGAELHVVYLPERSLVTDHYLQFDARCSKMPVGQIAMTEPRYQTQRSSLARQCQRVGVPFLDLTPVVAAEEAAGKHLYWDYDDHMRGEGYLLLGQTIFEEWTKGAQP